MKTLHNTDASDAKQNISDLEIWGDGDTFKLICKASSYNEGWMKSTKALQITGVGCVVQVTTQQMGRPNSPSEGSFSLAEALTFVPGVRIEETEDDNGNVVGRKLVAM